MFINREGASAGEVKGTRQERSEWDVLAEAGGHIYICTM